MTPRRKDRGPTPRAGTEMSAQHQRIFTLYRLTIVGLGFGATIFSGYRIVHESLGWQWMALASLALLTGSCTIRIPGIRSKISVGETFIITNLLMFGPAAGCITGALDGLLGSRRCKKAANRGQCLMFNMAVMALSAFAGGEVFYALLGKPAVTGATLASMEEMLFPLGALALVYFMVNTGAVAAVLGLSSRQNIFQIWKQNFLWLAANYVTAAITAGLLALRARAVTPAMMATILAAVACSYFICANYDNTCKT